MRAGMHQIDDGVQASSRTNLLKLSAIKLERRQSPLLMQGIRV
jgi:hypothetical protein